MDKSRFGKDRWIILILFGLIGQIAWSVENMYFNTFVFYKIAPDLSSITLMVQLSGIVATVATLLAGALSDRAGNRRSFIAWGYIIWGVTVALFGFITPGLFESLFGMSRAEAVNFALVTVIIGDCIMTLFGSTANDASFNAWVTDNTKREFRGTVEGVLSILPLLAILIVAGGFGILVNILGYSVIFLALGIIISISGVLGLVLIKDSSHLEKNGTMRDIFYGFKPSVIKKNAPLYISLIIVLIYGIACQIFMPFLIIYMSTSLGFTNLEYSAVFAIAIILGAGVNLYLTRLSDRKNKTTMLYFATGIFAIGLFSMYLARGLGNMATLVLFGVAGAVMICGYIFISALSGSIVRDYTPKGEVGKLQGVRMVFSVLIPMVVGPMIGNIINKTKGDKLPDSSSADAMTTAYIPAAEIFLAAGIVALLLFVAVPILKKAVKIHSGKA